MALFKKIAELRKNKRIRKTIAVVTSGVTLRFASMNFDSLAPVPDVSNKSPSIIVFSDQELDSLDDPNSEVTLVKAGDSTPSAPTSGQPSNFPTGGRPGRPVYVNPYRVAPKLLDQELGAGNNPAGAGGNGAADFDPNLNDQCPASQQGQSSDPDPSYQKKKKKKQCELENSSNIPESGVILEGSEVRVESLLGTSSGFTSQYERLKKNSLANKQATSSMEKLADGSLKIGDKNVKKIKGMKTIFEAISKDTRVYFKMAVDGKTVQVILPALKTDQKKSIKLLKKYFE